MLVLVLLSLALIAAVELPLGEVYAAGGAFGGGTGTAEDPYIVEDVADLQAMNSDLTAYYALANHIDASVTVGWNGGQGFLPVGGVTRFSGGLDGRGYTIRGLFIYRPTADNVGLFGHVGDDIGTTIIRNLGLIDATIVGARGTGTLIGKVTGNANTLIESCYAVGGSVVGNGATGGLIGSFNSYQETPGGTNNPVLHYSYTHVSVSSAPSGGGRDKFGGLAGCSQKGTIQNSYSRSSVTVTNGLRIGGLAGCIDNRGEILNSYSTGLVTATDCMQFGGLVGNRAGQGANLGVVTNCFWDLETSGQPTSAGGTGKTTSEMKTATTYTGVGWNFDDIWGIEGAVNNGYPHLVWEDYTPGELTISGIFAARNKSYDRTSDAEFDSYSLSLSGMSSGDDVDLVDTVIRFSSVNAAGNQTVNVASAALTGTDAGKYLLSLIGAPTAVADITPRNIAAAAHDKCKLYGTADPPLTWHITEGSLVPDDMFTGDLTRVAGEAIGSYPILQGTLAVDDGMGGDNYNLIFAEGTMTISYSSALPLPPCFIATAAYGSPMAGEIQILRDFRDRYLLTNTIGQALVGLYYRVSPPFAELITEHPGLKPIVRAGLLPAVTMSAIVVSTTPAQKIAILGALVLLLAGVTAWATKRLGRQREHLRA